MRIAGSVVYTVLSLQGTLLMSNTAQIQVLDTIQGTNFIAVQAALPTFGRTGLDLASYRITVLGEGNSLIVTFTDKNGPAFGRGSPGIRPGYQVELDRNDLRVLQASFLR